MEQRRREEAPESGDELLIIRPSNLFRAYEEEFTAKFKVLKAYESPLPTETFLRAHAHSAKAIMSSRGSPVTAELLCHLPSLGLVANTADAFSEDTADYGVGLLLDIMRKISGGDRFLRRGLWPLSTEQNPVPLGFKVGSKRVGIVGVGNIGCKVAKRLKAFGCKISYYSRSQKPSLPYKFYPRPWN